jgi:MtrB/PioB family decaheme-associated outer membrane protein
MEIRSPLISLAVASILSAAAGVAAADTAAPDTSGWTCSKCPFDKGYRSNAELGGAYVDDDSAKFGDYTGLDQKGGYVIANAEGKATEESGYTLSYELTDLGLDSRAARVEGGKQGRYEFELFYDAIPHTIWDTTSTAYRGVDGSVLSLPDDWVRAGSTSGMTALAGDLRSVDIGFDRDRYGAAGTVWFGGNLQFTLDYRRDVRDGTRTQFGAFGSTSTELIKPIDDATDRLDAKLRWQGAHWYLEAGYSGSIYDTKAAYLRWDNPFTAMVAGGDVGQMALAPDNDYHEFALAAGWYGLPGNTTISVSAASGKGSQDIGFLPYTTNPYLATDALPFSSLDGDVTVTRADLTISAHPIDRLRLRGAVTYDERDNKSRQGTFSSIVYTDLFPIGGKENPLYGFERTRAYGSADFRVYDTLSIGIGGEYRETDRTGTAQEVKNESLLDGWGKVQYRPTGFLGIVIRGGAEERDPDKYDTDVAEADGQNPLMRKYNMAYRYRSYGEAVVNAALGSLPLTLSANAFYGDDSYNLSQLGLVSGLDRRYGVDLTWAVNDRVSTYANVGQEKVSARMLGSNGFSYSDWRSFVEDDFTTYGAGLRASFGEDVDLDLSYTYAEGQSDTTLYGVSAGSFPTVESQLSSFRADFNYGLTERLDVAFTFRHERFDSKDWALQGIGPATMPTILALGADPYNYSVNYVGASLRYYFGARKIEAPE